MMIFNSTEYIKQVITYFSRVLISHNKQFIPSVYFTLLCLTLSSCRWPLPLSEKPSKVPHPYNLQLGIAYLKTDDKSNAKVKLFQAEQQDPNNAIIKSTIAYFLEQINELDRAEAYHLKALHVDPNNGMANNNYGRFLCQCGRYKQAEIYFLKAVQDIQYTNIAYAYENAGLCAMRANDLQKAILYLERALQYNSHLQKSWLGLAMLHQHHDQKLAYRYLQRYEKIVTTPSVTARALRKSLSEHISVSDKIAR